MIVSSTRSYHLQGGAGDDERIAPRVPCCLLQRDNQCSHLPLLFDWSEGQASRGLGGKALNNFLIFQRTLNRQKA